MTSARCPRCGHSDITVRKYTLPSSRGGDVTVYDYFCQSCQLLETIDKDEPGWQQKKARWERQEGAPRSLDVFWWGDGKEYRATVETTSGEQQWRLVVNDAEPRYTLTINDHQVERINSDEWPQTWTLASGAKTPLEPRTR
jgi:hypothetical protein